MRVSAKTDYALRALVEIGRRGDGGGPVAADDVAGAQGIPRGFLLGILGDLRSPAWWHSWWTARLAWPTA